MGVNHLGPGSQAQEFQRLWQAIRAVAKTTLQNGAIGRAGLRIYDGGWLLIENGGLDIEGTANVSGLLTGNGTFDWWGPSVIRGTLNVTGNSAFGGTMAILGLTTLANDLNLSTGRITAGPLIIDRNGPYGGRIASTGFLVVDAASAILLGAQTTVQGALTAVGLVTGTSMQSLSNISALGNITALGDIGGGSKSFWIDHPTMPGKQLRHGSLEGPEHGVYYRGVVEFDAAGEATFQLPEYFSALVLDADEPTVQVTSIGRPFLAGAERVADGAVTIYGDAGREAHVTVTAARGLFDVEPDKVPLEPIASEWTPPTTDDEETS